MRNNDLTVLINKALAGDSDASQQAFAETYPDLCRLAHLRLRGRHHNTVDTRMVVHESFLRFQQLGNLAVEDRLHFYRYASRVMRSVILDMARKKARDASRGDKRMVKPDGINSMEARSDPDILDIHRALVKLEAHDAQMASIVEMKYFAGMTEMDIAESMGVTDRTVRRIWQRAKIWLRAALEGMEL